MKKISVVLSLFLSILITTFVTEVNAEIAAEIVVPNATYLTNNERFLTPEFTQKISINPELWDGDLTKPVLTLEQITGSVQSKNMLVYEFDDLINIKVSISSTINTWGGATYTVYLYDDQKRVIYNSGRVNQTFTANINVKNVKYAAIYNNGVNNHRITEFALYAPLPEYHDISKLTLTNKENEILLKWEFEHSLDRVVGFNIYRDGELLKTLNPNDITYIDAGLSAGKTYVYTVKTLYKDGTETIGESRTGKTLEILKEVSAVDAKTYHNRVNLSWKLPQQDGLSHINIYRDEIIKETALETLFIGSRAYAATKIFETNGTYFNDLTVKADTQYEYKLTTQLQDGRESEGVLAKVVTPPSPLPEIVGDGYEKDENGDYLYKWTSPTTGKVKVLIDGKEYKIVEASLKQILIPAADLKYDMFNHPKVSLVAISEDGKEGTPTVPKPGQGGGTGTIKIPFDVKELLESGFGLLKIVGPFVLLGLSFLLVNPIRKLIRQALLNYRERSINK